MCYVFVPDHLRKKIDNKAIRCIFVGYDNQRKGWRCVDPINRRCYTSRNVIFDEASSWWALELEKKPTYEKSFKEGSKEEINQVQQTPIEGEEENNKDDEEQSRSQSPWQSGVHNQGPHLQRSTRLKKPYFRYVNAALATFKEPKTYEEASQNIQWRKAMEEEQDALKKLNVGLGLEA